MLPMDKSVTFTGACANEIIPSINRSFVYKAKEGGYVRINILVLKLVIIKKNKYFTCILQCFMTCLKGYCLPAA